MREEEEGFCSVFLINMLVVMIMQWPGWEWNGRRVVVLYNLRRGFRDLRGWGWGWEVMSWSGMEWFVIVLIGCSNRGHRRTCHPPRLARGQSKRYR